MEKKQSRFHWGWRIGIIYTTFALATIGFMIFSFTQKVDLVSKQYYADELKHDAKMLAEKNAMDLQEELSLISEGNLLTVRFPNIPDGGTVHLYRPSESDMDKKLTITPDKTEQAFSIAQLASGLWIAKVEWKSGNTTFYAEQRFSR
jgi:hypothetical protein